LIAGLICASALLVASQDKIAHATENPDRQEIVLLRAQLAAQQAQIDQLRKELQEQRELIERTHQPAGAASSLHTAGSAPVVDPGPVTGLSSVTPVMAAVPATDQSQSVKQAMPAAESKLSPLSLSIGATQITPIGFMDFTAILRSKNVGSGLGTNFGAIPFKDSVNGNLSEYRLSAQNSRLGARLDTEVRGVNLLGYLETDFLGYTPGNAAVTSNSDSLRLRLFWAKLRKGKFEVLAAVVEPVDAQPKGNLPSTRRSLLDAGCRSQHPGGVDLGAQSATPIDVPPERYGESRVLGGSRRTIRGWLRRGGAITLPSALVSSYSGQLNTGSTGLSVPSPNQDLIGKVAFDPRVGNRSLHIELAALLRRFEFYNPLSQQIFKAAGGGGA
jgi:hypothetical protein